MKIQRYSRSKISCLVFLHFRLTNENDFNRLTEGIRSNVHNSIRLGMHVHRTLLVNAIATCSSFPTTMKTQIRNLNKCRLDFPSEDDEAFVTSEELN